MKIPRNDLVSAALRDPGELPAWPLRDWERLVWQARSANLLARIALLVEERSLLEQVPAAPRAHLDAARVVALAHLAAVRREVRYIQEALAPIDVDVILLKGAGYVMAELPPAQGRLFSDVDILVPKEALPRVESALMLRGWATTHHDRYDQRYYRRWMHELPPLRHMHRQTVLDVHYGILPLTARLHPDATKLIAASRPVAGDPRLRVLAPADMVLHSAVHLFHNETFEQGLRDLVDVDTLLRHFGRDPGFVEGVTSRAEELGLTRPWYYALRFGNRILGTPLPGGADRRSLPGRPAAAVHRVMDALFDRVLHPQHPSASDWMTPFARRALYVRAHWLRMPPALLAVHLTVKAFRRNTQQAA